MPQILLRFNIPCTVEISNPMRAITLYIYTINLKLSMLIHYQQEAR